MALTELNNMEEFVSNCVHVFRMIFKPLRLASNSIAPSGANSIIFWIKDKLYIVGCLLTICLLHFGIDIEEEMTQLVHKLKLNAGI